MFFFSPKPFLSIPQKGTRMTFRLWIVSQRKNGVCDYGQHDAPEASVIRNLWCEAICNQTGGLCRYRLKAYFCLRWVKLWFRKRRSSQSFHWATVWLCRTGTRDKIQSAFYPLICSPLPRVLLVLSEVIAAPTLFGNLGASYFLLSLSHFTLLFHSHCQFQVLLP